ncbi:glycosyltransferase family 4 protein [Alteromonas sediminis]|uniref:Glycosyltransferase family 4 protein n=1 Tax=Alteromonas sediminis TaxID=2259342 RepID=A0A3N5Y3A7_9ALTE|nr:glycosyltransferase [Alteromonas sediminis]RPJ68497.1 glycosyltransferase family 4 protein [Alteromonas sediminis]
MTTWRPTINILMLTNTYLPHVGGVANSVYQTASVLRDKGHKVLIIAPDFEGSEAPLYEQIDDVIRVPAIQNYNGSDFSVRVAVPFALTTLLDGLHIDIIHSHHPFLLGDTAVRLSHRYQVPLVFTHHTRYEQYTHYVLEDSSVMAQFAAELATTYANMCNAVVAPSTSIKQMINDRGVTVPVEVIPTGVVLDNFKQADKKAARDRLNIAEDVRILGHLGRLAEEKNLHFLADAMLELLEQNDNTTWLIAGSGPCEEAIKDKAQSCGLHNRIQWLGNVSGQDLVDAYAAMDVFVFASQSETQGMVVTEAMAAGVPVVALAAPGVDDVVNDANGLHLPKDSTPASFAAQCNTLLKDTNSLSAKRAEALKTAETFSDSRSAERLLALYADTLKTYQAPFETHPGLEAMDNLRAKLQAEWQLLQQKFDTVTKTFQVNGNDEA